MHTHLVVALFCVTFFVFFWVVNVVGAVVHITQLYNLGAERLKKEDNWSHV